MGYFDKLKDLANKLGENVTSTPQQQYSQQPIAPPPPLPNAAPPAMPVMPSVPQQSSTQIYNNQLEALIEAALADGVLTEKEKQILFKKAQMQGIDLDEFEMVLEAKLFEKRKSMQAVVSQQTSAAPRSNKYGDVRKCPSCGAMVESFSVRCPECGFEFNNVNANMTVTQFFNRMQQIEENSNSNLLSVYTKGLGVNKTINMKKSLIVNFPVPTTREDILEFLTLAVPQARKQSLFKRDEDYMYLRPVWLKKCEQIIMKARFSFKEDKKTLEEIEHYAKELGIKK